MKNKKIIKKIIPGLVLSGLVTPNFTSISFANLGNTPPSNLFNDENRQNFAPNIPEQPRNIASVEDTVGNIRYKFFPTRKVASILGFIAETNEDNSNIENLKIDSNVNYIGGQYKIVAIDNDAFKNRTDITGTLTIGKNVRYIHPGAFSGCIGINKIVFENDSISICAKTFENCTGLESIEFSSYKNTISPDKSTMIKNDSFAGCSNLTEAKIPVERFYIKPTAFDNVENIRWITQIQDDEVEIELARSGPDDFVPAVLIDNLYYMLDRNGNNASILSGAINGKQVDENNRANFLVENLTIKNKVTFNGQEFNVISVGWNAFENCTGITGTVTIENGIEYIFAKAFLGCIGINKIVFENDSIGIFAKAFENCTGLESIEFSNYKNTISPDKSTRIHNDSFAGCYNLTEAKIPIEHFLVAPYAFDNVENIRWTTLSVDKQELRLHLILNNFVYIPVLKSGCSCNSENGCCSCHNNE